MEEDKLKNLTAAENTGLSSALKKEHYIYYGVLFFFLYLNIYHIISRCLVCGILSLEANIFLIPVALGVLILGLLTIFCSFKTFPKIKLWVILIVVGSLAITNLLFVPSNYYLRADSLYSLGEKESITSFITYCDAINNVAVIVAAYIKYTITQRVKIATL